MSDADKLGILTMVLCLIGSMFFSGSETALTSLGTHHARKIQEEGGRRGKTVSTWVEQPVRVLSTILVGNNVTNTLMGSVATALAIRHLAGGTWGEYAVPVAVFFTTAVLLVFGEILPKAAGRVYAHRLALPVLSVLNVLDKLLAPVTWGLSKITDLMLRRAADEEGQKVTADELDYLVKVGQREGSIPADQAELLRGIFRFEDKIVRDIMVPENKVTAIDLAWGIDQVIDRAKTSGHSRLPLYEEDLDHIVGVLHIKQLVGLRRPGRADIKRVMRPPMFIADSLLIQDLLRRFREKRVHLAIVVDDGGHTVGVVTLEDVLEQIVGQIFDESDRAPAGGMEHAGIVYVDGQAALTQVEETFGVEFEELEGVDSVGDLLTQLGGEMPTTGSVFVYEGIRFKVLAANDRRVIRVSVEQVDVDDDDDA
ncbi:MAG: hemolysin family protein [Deltaproteobacteria bacterium]|nr:hemolysin family protein [Deltaproteobacteria bacterium]